jgi:tRNA 2-thiouridine synthesizing protein A
MAEVDVRGFSCPIPFVKTKKAMERNPGEIITVLLEAEVSKENVTRLAEHQGYSIKEEKFTGEYRLTLTPSVK